MSMASAKPFISLKYSATNISLLQHHLAPDLSYTSSDLGGEHGGETPSDFSGGVPPNHLAEDLLGHLFEQNAKEPLICVLPDSVGRVADNPQVQGIAVVRFDKYLSVEPTSS
jgi:hypothetical protein